MTAAGATIEMEWARASGVRCMSAWDRLLGSELAGIRIERPIAEGGVGIVYEGVDVASGRALAVKVLHPRHAGDLGIESRFEREIAFARRVAHPGVFEVLASGVLDDGRPYFVMPRYEGETLGSLIRRTGALSVERARAVGIAVLEALEALHASRIVHRDIQPDNVFLTRDERGEEKVLLLDLGFAAEPGVDDGDGVTPDSPGSLVGTLNFMAPEQATRGRAIDERSDLFAAALLVYYALTAKLPFSGRDDIGVVVSIVRAAPVPLRRARRDVSRGLEAVIARALAKHPEARFRSANEMCAALGSSG